MPFKGVANGKTIELEAKASNLFTVFPFEPVREETADLHAKVKRTRQLKGLTLDENDLWIAATALTFGAVLISRDSDFQLVTD